jgi:peptide/nickel transport system ATP-binding protein
MIEVQHLNLAFGEGEKRNQVLYDVSFHVKPGEIYGLVGSPAPVKPRC